MSENQTVPQPSLEVQPGEANTIDGDDTSPNPSELTPVDSTPKGLRGAGLRYTEADGVPEWAVGKTADEILEITKTLHSTMQTQQPQQQQQYTPAPVAQAQPVGVDLNGDMLFREPDRFIQGMQQYTTSTIDERIAKASEPLLAPLATMARNEAQRDPAYSDVWKRYSPEIDAVMQTVPLQNRGDVALWRQAAELVAGKHYRELAKVEAERIAASGDSGMIPTGGVPSTPVSTSLSPIDALFAKNDPSIQKFKDGNISAAQVKGFAANMGHTEEKYAEMLTSNQNIRVG